MVGWKKQVRDRLIYVFYFVALLFLVLCYRLVDIQIFQHDLYKAKAEDQHKGTVTIPALRGSIMDRKYVVLANSLALTSITADPTMVKDRHKTAVLLFGRIRRSFRKQIECCYKICLDRSKT